MNEGLGKQNPESLSISNVQIMFSIHTSAIKIYVIELCWYISYIVDKPLHNYVEG